MDVRVGLWRKLSAEELMLLNCGVGEDSWELLGLQKIQPVHPKGDQSWVFFGRTDAKAETPILGPPHAKSWLIGKDFDAGRDLGQEEKGMTDSWMASPTDLVCPDLFQSNGTLLQYSCLENPMDGGAWWAKVHGSQRVGHDWATSLSLSSPVATAEFSKFAGILSATLSKHHLSGFEIAQLAFHHLH